MAKARESRAYYDGLFRVVGKSLGNGPCFSAVVSSGAASLRIRINSRRHSPGAESGR
jgi:hypothetical protein